MIRPIKTYSRISTKFGSTAWPDSASHPHKGYDYVCPIGTPIYSPITGKVTLSTYGTGGGNQIEVTGGGYSHRVLHLESRKVSAGASVKEGQLIGYSGNTGTQTTGAHLHWDARKAGVAWNAGFKYYVDPERLLATTNKPKEVNMPTLTTKADLDFLYLSDLGRNRNKGEGEDVYLNKDYRFVDRDLFNSSEAKKTRAAASARLAALNSRVDTLEKQLATRPKTVPSDGFNASDRANLGIIKTLVQKIAGIFK